MSIDSFMLISRKTEYMGTDVDGCLQVVMGIY